MPPKQPPTLKPISSDSSSDSEDNESKPDIQSKSVTKKELIESDSDSDTKTKEKKETKTKESKPDNITLLLNIVNEEKQLFKKLSELQKEKENLIKILGKESGKNKEKKSREPPKPLDEIPPIIKKFIKCDDDAKFTMMELSQQLRKKLISNGKEQIITKSQLTELKINEKDRKELELEEVNKEELKEDISQQLTDKKEKYYVVKFGKLLSIVSFLLKQ